jgi:hypothetical protein
VADEPRKPDMRFAMVRTRTQGQKPFELDDPAFRSRAVSLASTGMSRRGVAQLIGKPRMTLITWLDRGQATPDVEPWGSFAVDYLRAERGLERACSSAIALRVQNILERQEAHMNYRGKKAENRPPEPPLGEVMWLQRLLIDRYPQDHGAQALREPEKDPDGPGYIERQGLSQAQLRVLVSNPPEEIRGAMFAEAQRIFEMLTEMGFKPPTMVDGQPKKE